jgi:TolB-like protein
MKASVPRRLLIPLLSLAVALLGATPLILPTPSIVVYPLIANGSGVTSETGSRISVTIATQIAQLGGVSVKAAPPEVQQHDFLIVARQLGVDFYVTGYVTPLGDQASVVEQVVSAKSGSIIWSNTAQLTTYGEAVGQGTIIRSAILTYAGRTVSSLQPIEPTPAVVRAAPTPSHPPLPKKVAVLSLSGDVEPDRVAYAATSMMKALAKNKVPAARTQSVPQDVQQSARTICAKTGATLLLGGTVSTQSSNESSATANVVVTGYDCSGTQVGSQTASSNGDGKRAWQVAIDRAIDTAVRDYLQTRTGS